MKTHTPPEHWIVFTKFQKPLDKLASWPVQYRFDKQKAWINNQLWVAKQFLVAPRRCKEGATCVVTVTFIFPLFLDPRVAAVSVTRSVCVCVCGCVCLIKQARGQGGGGKIRSIYQEIKCCKRKVCTCVLQTIFFQRLRKATAVMNISIDRLCPFPEGQWVPQKKKTRSGSLENKFFSSIYNKRTTPTYLNARLLWCSWHWETTKLHPSCTCSVVVAIFVRSSNVSLTKLEFVDKENLRNPFPFSAPISPVASGKCHWEANV